MGAIIYFCSLLILAFLTLSAQARTFPGEGKAVVIIYRMSSSSLHLDLSAILSAIKKHDIDINNNNEMVEAPVRPRPKKVPSPKPASPIAELTSSSTSTDDGIITMVTADPAGVQGRKVLTPPPSPKPAPRHDERTPPATAGGFYYSSSS